MRLGAEGGKRFAAGDAPLMVQTTHINHGKRDRGTAAFPPAPTCVPAVTNEKFNIRY